MSDDDVARQLTGALANENRLKLGTRPRFFARLPA
jgi:hypothetical protein